MTVFVTIPSLGSSKAFMDVSAAGEGGSIPSMSFCCGHSQIDLGLAKRSRDRAVAIKTTVNRLERSGLWDCGMDAWGATVE